MDHPHSILISLTSFSLSLLSHIAPSSTGGLDESLPSFAVIASLQAHGYSSPFLDIIQPSCCWFSSPSLSIHNSFNNALFQECVFFCKIWLPWKELLGLTSLGLHLHTSSLHVLSLLYFGLFIALRTILVWTVCVMQFRGSGRLLGGPASFTMTFNLKNLPFAVEVMS